MKLVLCVPTLTKPYQVTLDSIAASVPLLDEAKIDHNIVSEIGCPYISCARATMLRKALDAKADVIVFIDHDVSWKPADLLTLVQSEGDVVCGTYRFKQDKVEYMGDPCIGDSGKPLVRDSDGAVLMQSIPAGFLKVTRQSIWHFMRSYPNLVYGDPCNPGVDLFNHGAHEGTWWGEDYAFARNWRNAGGEVWCLPKLEITHHTPEKAYEGNYHKYLIGCPGGKEHQ